MCLMTVEEREPFFPQEISLPPFSDIEERMRQYELQSISRNHMLQSGINTLAMDLADKLHGSYIEEDLEVIGSRPPQLLSKESFYIAISFTEKRLSKGQYEGDAIIIESFPNGPIIVYGNAVGSTVLTKADWFGHMAPQIKALEKARENPTKLISMVEEIEADYKVNL